MPLYHDLKAKTPAGQRTLTNILKLREAMAGVPDRTLDQTLLLATWNIREFDSPKYGDRIDESYYYIAEIIDHFDLVAVQEVYQDLKAFKRLCGILGENWKFIFTDKTLGVKGNKERMAFLYDSRKVKFGGLAGELVLPDIKIEVADPDGEIKKVDQGVVQFARTPFIVGFTAGYADFMLCTVHILWGSKRADDERRVQEIRKLAKELRERTEDDSAWARNLILLGDFNIFNRKDVTMEALLDEDFVIPEGLHDIPGTNVDKSKHYDQIAFQVREKKLEPTGKAGVFDFFETVFRREDEAVYVRDMGADYATKKDGNSRTEQGKHSYYGSWRTHQMSDHLPMWVELQIDYTDEYLVRLRDEP